MYIYIYIYIQISRWKRDISRWLCQIEPDEAANCSCGNANLSFFFQCLSLGWIQAVIFQDFGTNEDAGIQKTPKNS